MKIPDMLDAVKEALFRGDYASAMDLCELAKNRIGYIRFKNELEPVSNGPVNADKEYETVKTDAEYANDYEKHCSREAISWGESV